mgnify:CR=1 FL=1
MDRGKIDAADFRELQVPARVTIPQLQTQFQERYELDETISWALVISSSESLREVLTESEKILVTCSDDMDYEPIRPIVHRIKGLFLNMGAEEWASYVTSLKKSRKGQVYSNFQKLMENIQKNFNEIIILCEK